MKNIYKLTEDYKCYSKDELFKDYNGHTYGCIKKNHIAVTRLNDNIFIEIPIELLECTGNSI